MFANRMSFIEPSGTLKLQKMARDLQAKGQDIISFGIGEMDYPTPKRVVNAAKKALDKGLTKYAPSRGLPELREAIAKHNREKSNIRCGPDNVLVTPAKFAIYLSCVALLDIGEEALIPDPRWVSYPDMVYAVGGRPKYYKLSKDYFLPDEEDLKRQITKKTKLIMLNTPSNPAGSVFPKESIRMVSDLAIDHGLFVVSDEIYDNQVYDGKHYSLASLRGMARRTITVNGFSKTYSMTGWRIGWVIAPTSLVDAMTRLQEHTITCLPTFVQMGGLAALQGSQAFIERIRKQLKRKRDLIHKGLNSIDGIECQKPQGTFYIFPRYDFDMNSENLAEYLLNKVGVLTVPGRVFGRMGGHHLRMAFAKEKKSIEEGLRRLELALGKIKR